MVKTVAADDECDMTRPTGNFTKPVFDQRDKRARLFVQYLAICDSENLPVSEKINQSRFNIGPPKNAKTFCKFLQMW